jgi:hypothetical protein
MLSEISAFFQSTPALLIYYNGMHLIFLQDERAEIINFYLAETDVVSL